MKTLNDIFYSIIGWCRCTWYNMRYADYMLLDWSTGHKYRKTYNDMSYNVFVDLDLVQFMYVDYSHIAKYCELVWKKEK